MPLRLTRNVGLTLLVLQAAALLAALEAAGRMGPHRVPDTASYLEFPWSDPPAALRATRTYGYPLFVQAVTAVAGEAWVPLVQASLYFVAVVLFWSAFRRWCRKEWLPLLAASSLLYSNLLLRYTATLGPDLPAAALGIAAMACTLEVARGARRPPAWIALALAVALAYHTRPAYLFLVVVVPMVGGVAAWLRSLPLNASPRPRRTAAHLLALTLLPLLAFCGLRWTVVGHFGLVAFGGYNASGLAVQVLQPQQIGRLPADLQPLAAEIVQRRAEYAAREPDFSTEFDGGYMAWEARWDALTWHVNVPAARQLYGEDPLLINRALARLSWALLRDHPAQYAQWLAKAAVRGIYMMVSETVMNPVYLALILVLIAGLFASAVRRLGTSVPVARDPDLLPAATMLLVAAAYSGGKLALVILNSPPLGRFMDAAGLFWPATLAIAVGLLLEAQTTGSGSEEAAQV